MKRGQFYSHPRMSYMKPLLFSSSPVEIPEAACKPVHVFEWHRVFAVVALVLSVVTVMESFRRDNAETSRQELSTEGRFLLSLADTGTGIMDVRPLTNSISYASPAACEILGYYQTDLTNRSINDILPVDFRAFHQQRVRDAMAKVANNTEHMVSFMDCQALRKDGKPVNIKVCVFVSRNGIIALINRADEVHHFVMPNVPN